MLRKKACGMIIWCELIPLFSSTSRFSQAPSVLVDARRTMSISPPLQQLRDAGTGMENALPTDMRRFPNIDYRTSDYRSRRYSAKIMLFIVTQNC
ncbi:hypothetical protein ElyMa_005270800 [Elysia marginata]|uniref:Secreted protein n=1 Tax=Elysia marginata TaxID=1093978 RepID=A0AAV4JXC5_9GAST|nr:hypothetical protein ElyMa_005270800 [Elysia marginata]